MRLSKWTVATIAATGSYFLFTKRGIGHRKAFAGWMFDIKDQVMKKLSTMKDVDQKAFNRVVDETIHGYSRVKKMTSGEMRHLGIELKKAWKDVRKEFALN